MSTLLSFLLLLLLLMLVAAVFVGVKVYHTIHDVTSRFKQQMKNGNGTASSQKPNTERRTPTANGDEIIDRRDPTKASQKIFKEDEGEYVDYKEE